MDFLFRALDTCDPGTICLDDDERRKVREEHFWRQDGMKYRSSSKKRKLKKTVREASIPEEYPSVTKGTTNDDDTATEMQRTYTTASETYSSDSDESEWSRFTAGTQNSKNNYSSWLQPDYEIIDEPELANVWSSDSAGAVKSSRRGNRSVRPGDMPLQSAFDYIRRARQNLSNSNPMNDPPSDKSMATSRSVVASDIGSVLIRQGIIRNKKKSLLMRAILKQRENEVQQAGTSLAQDLD